jgi:hypothetical protein
MKILERNYTIILKMEIQITEINGVVRDERKNERKKQLSHRHV